MYHQKRQSHKSDTPTNCDTPTQDANPSPVWINHLILKKCEKLVSTALQEDDIRSQQTGSIGRHSIDSNEILKSECDCNSLGNNSSIECNNSCPHNSNTNTGQVSNNKAVHLISASAGNAGNANSAHSAAQSVNVPILRSVSSSLLTDRQCCCCCYVVSTDCDETQSVTKCSTQSTTTSTTTTTTATTTTTTTTNTKLNYDYDDINTISSGIVATRRNEFIKRQVSDSSFLISNKICNKCDKTCVANHHNRQSVVSKKMIDEKIKEENSEYNRNGDHELIFDFKQTNSRVKTSFIENSNQNGYYEDVDYAYGPGIVDKLKLKFLNISIQQSKNINNKMKRCSSLENISVDNENHTNDQHYYVNQSQTAHTTPYATPHTTPLTPHSQLQPQQGQGHNTAISHLQTNESQLNSFVNVRSIASEGNRANGSDVLHKHYIQHHNSRNIYNNNKLVNGVPLIKRAKSMETLLFQESQSNAEKVRQPFNQTLSNQLNRQLSTPDNATVVSTPICSDSSNLNQCDVENKFIENSNSNSNANDVNDNNQCEMRVTDDKVIKLDTTMKSASNANNAISAVNTANNANNEHNDELPKPDTVKTYKRIFEPISANVNKTYKKIVSQTNGSKRKPPVLRASAKSSNLKISSLNNSSSTTPTTLTTPTPTTITPIAQSTTTSPLPSVRTTVRENNEINGNKSGNKNVKNSISNSNNNNTNKSANNTTLMKKPPIAPKRLSLINVKTTLSSGNNANKNVKMKSSNGHSNSKVIQPPNNKNTITNITTEATINQENCTDLISSPIAVTVPEVMERTSISNSNTTIAKKEIHNSSNVSKANVNVNGENNDHLSNGVKVNKPIANIKPFTQSNNINNDSNQKSEVINEHNDHESGHEDSKEIEINDNINIQNKEINLNNDDNNNNNEKMRGSNETPIHSIISSNMVEKNADIISAVNDENVSPNLCDKNMVDKNKIQRIEDHQQTQQNDILKPSLLLNKDQINASNIKLNSSLWSQPTKKSNNSSTTFIFDFRGKDVKPNLAIQPIPFGVSSAARTKSINGGIFNGFANESEEDDNYTGSTDIPLPCGVIFSGENMKIGKGSLLLTRNKKLKIQFNDMATATFEYPSEISLMEENLVVPTTPTTPTTSEDTKSETNNITLSKLKTHLSLGGSSGGLASYKPTLLETIDTPFELGISRPPKAQHKTESVTNETDSNKNVETEDISKQANGHNTVSWSTSSTASEMLF